MTFDFSAFLVLAAAITGAIWAADALLFARKRSAELAIPKGGSALGSEAREPLIVEYSKSFFPVILVVLVLRSFLVEPFKIPSGSMMPTLLAGDFILVNKFTYGIRLPVINKKIVDMNLPERGDVVVFRYPVDPSTDYIKRVIGLPGDKISYRNKRVYVNGVPQQQSPMGRFLGHGSAATMNGAFQLTEQLGERKHDILVRGNVPDHGYPCLLGGEYVVPDGNYFVMGDNRDNSNDSRFWCSVPEENLVGKAFFIWMNWDVGGAGISWNRIGTKIE